MYLPPMLLFFLLLWLWGSSCETEARLKALEPAKAAVHTPHAPTSTPPKTRFIDNDFVVIGSLFGMSAALLWLVATFGV